MLDLLKCIWDFFLYSKLTKNFFVVSLEIKPKEEVGGGPQAKNDDFGSFEQELRRANEEMMREVSEMRIFSKNKE